MKTLLLPQIQDDKSKNCVYVVRSSDNKCIYVGRTSRALKSRIREHLIEQSDIGRYLEANKDAVIKVYKPSECIDAIEYIYGPGWNPDYVGLIAAEESMIVFLEPLLNRIHYKSHQHSK